MLSIEKSIVFSLCAGLLFLMAGCSSKDLANKTPEQIDLQKAKDFQSIGRYDLALERYENIKNKYPLSPEAIEAELEISETYYLQASYPEALVAFQTFRDLHPIHKRIDFAYFRVAMCHYMQLPSTIDRDLTDAKKAIEAFEDFLSKYPKSTYVAEAKEKRQDCIKKLSEKEYYIANYYYNQKVYSSAIGRFKTILQRYKDAGLEEKVLFQLGMCYYFTDKKAEAKNTLTQFLKKYPDSKSSKEANEVLHKI